MKCTPGTDWYSTESNKMLKCIKINNQVSVISIGILVPYWYQTVTDIVTDTRLRFMPMLIPMPIPPGKWYQYQYSHMDTYKNERQGPAPWAFLPKSNQLMDFCITVWYRHGTSWVMVQYRHGTSWVTVQYRHGTSWVTVLYRHLITTPKKSSPEEFRSKNSGLQVFLVQKCLCTKNIWI